ncbi:hypothetical protein EDD11_009909 [Mortierella claussenii]|nr:hypothetical protein EDD11_009909 [Mortierella claussenii]
MSTVKIDGRGPSQVLDQIRHLINCSDDVDSIALLVALSDPSWLRDTSLQFALLQDNDTVNHLLDTPDPYLQFVVYRLIKVALLQSGTSAESNDDPLVLYQLHRAVVLDLLKRLADNPQITSFSQQHQHSQEAQQERQLQPPQQQQRAVLELLHAIFKHHRHWIRSMREDGEDESKETPANLHAASIIVEELAQSRFWGLALTRHLRAIETQHATLVLLIDLEKYRTQYRVQGAFERHIELCHQHLIRVVDQFLDVSRFQLFALRKLFELLCLLLQEPSIVPATQPKGDCQDTSRDFSLSTHIFDSLSSWCLQALVALHKHDPRLDRFSTGSTMFILAKETTYPDIDLTLQPLVSNPEAIRQLGRVMLSAVLSILTILTTISQYPEQGPISDKGVMPLMEQLQVSLPKMLSFIHAWIGSGTLNLLMRIYGEDDAGISWLLMSMCQIQQRLDHLCTHSLFVLQPMAKVSSTTIATSATAATTNAAHITLSRAALSTLREGYSHLHRYVHPLDAFFLFMTTIGYDDQTLLDLLLAPDDRQTGGMLAAVMMLLRAFTERISDQQEWTKRWQSRNIRSSRDSSQGMMVDDNDDPTDHLSEAWMQLCNVQLCFSRLARQIRRLHGKNLFPYNPRALLVVLDRTHEVLSSMVESAESYDHEDDSGQ